MRIILSFFWSLLIPYYAQAFQTQPTELLIRGTVTQNLQPQTIKTLIAQGADINAVYFDKKNPTFNHFQPVHIAALFGNTVLLKALVENGASLETPIKYPRQDSSTQRNLYDRYNAAMLIAQNYKGQDKQFLDFVFAKGVNYRKYQTKNGKNLLHAALNTPYPNHIMVKYLLDKDCNPLAEAKIDNDTLNLYHYFASIHVRFEENLAQQLYDKGLKKVYAIDSLSYLYHCIKFDKLEVLKFIMARGLINLKNESHPYYLNPLAAAAYHNHIAIFYYLWERLGYPDAKSNIGQELLKKVENQPNKLYERLINQGTLSNEELNFFNYANTSLFKGIEISYAPFTDSIFYKEDSSLYDKTALKGKKAIYLVGSCFEQYHFDTYNKINTVLYRCQQDNYQFLTLDYTNKNEYKSSLSNYYLSYRANYALLRVDAKKTVPQNTLRGVYLVDENNIVRAKIPYTVFLNSLGNYAMLFDYFMKI